MTVDELHDFQHRLIGERKTEFDALPYRSGYDKARRREVYKRAGLAL